VTAREPRVSISEAGNACRAAWKRALAYAGLTDSDFRVLGALVVLITSWSRTEDLLGRRQIAAVAGVSERTVGYALARLEAAGVIWREESRGGRGRSALTGFPNPANPATQAAAFPDENPATQAAGFGAETRHGGDGNPARAHAVNPAPARAYSREVNREKPEERAQAPTRARAHESGSHWEGGGEDRGSPEEPQSATAILQLTAHTSTGRVMAERAAARRALAELAERRAKADEGEAS
jgi:DNA-binding MarR family transcriptional regulator